MELNIDFDNVNDKKYLYEVLKQQHGRMTIKISQAKRTYDQLKYYWAGIVNPTAAHTGEDAYAIHCHWGAKFLLEYIWALGGGIWRIRSTDELNVFEMSDLIEKCIKDATDMGVTIHDSMQYRKDILELKAKEAYKIRQHLKFLRKLGADWIGVVHAAGNRLVARSEYPFLRGYLSVERRENDLYIRQVTKQQQRYTACAVHIEEEVYEFSANYTADQPGYYQLDPQRSSETVKVFRLVEKAIEP